MFAKLEVFRMSAEMAQHAGRRQALAAQNMANVDTPGYQARRLASFADLTKDTGVTLQDGFAGRATRHSHLHGSGDAVVNAAVTRDKSGAALDGNTVSAEREMLESVSAKREHDRAIAIYKSTLKILQTTLARS